MNKGKGQIEFSNMPERSPLGKKAIEYCNILDELQNKQDEKDKIKAELIEHFLASGKKSITVSGHFLTYSHKESDSVRVKMVAS